jgi:pimeloyl-ACP methyl ester carboxylesterase
MEMRSIDVPAGDADKLLATGFGPRVNHRGIAFRTIGSGRRLVLLHGGSGSRTHWIRNVAALSRHFTVVTVDLPGFGESADVPAQSAVANYAAWVADALADALDGERFGIVAFSFGSVVAAAALHRLRERGSLPTATSLIGPAGFGKPMGRTLRLETVPRGPGVTAEHVRNVTAINLGRWMLAKEPQADAEAVSIHLHNVSRARFDSRTISWGETLLPDLRADPLPLQVLIGAADVLPWPSATHRIIRIREAIPHARVTVIPDAGHWLQYEAASAVNQALISFHTL